MGYIPNVNETVCLAYNFCISIRPGNHSILRKNLWIYYIISLLFALLTGIFTLLNKEISYFYGKCELKYTVVSSLFYTLISFGSFFCCLGIYFYGTKKC